MKQIPDTLVDAINGRSEGEKKKHWKKDDRASHESPEVKAGCGSRGRKEECSCKMCFT